MNSDFGDSALAQDGGDAQQCLKAAFELLDQGHWVWDFEQHLYLDAKCCRMLGLDEGYRTWSLADFLVCLHERHHEWLLDAFDGVLEEQKDLRVELDLEKREGTLDLRGALCELTERRKVITGTMALVTAASGGEREQQQELEQLRESNSELQSFASVASHDLREPLRMISSYLRLLQERSPEALDARAQRYINYACEGADRMRTTIEDLLSYARLGNQQAVLEPLGLDQIFEEVVDNLGASIRNLDANVTVDIDHSPVILGDRSRLVRLFQNLVANAIKFHKEGAERRVAIRFESGSWYRLPDHCIVEVEDNGIGVDPDHVDLLFNVFQRLNTRDEYDGSGIGLAVCKRIVEQHDGRIWLKSEPGLGSTFYVALKNAKNLPD
ncbi:MAG: sensor histidine kinase [Coraliomargarita sp.]